MDDGSSIEQWQAGKDRTGDYRLLTKSDPATGIITEVKDYMKEGRVVTTDRIPDTETRRVVTKYPTHEKDRPTMRGYLLEDYPAKGIKRQIGVDALSSGQVEAIDISFTDEEASPDTSYAIGYTSEGEFTQFQTFHQADAKSLTRVVITPAAGGEQMTYEVYSGPFDMESIWEQDEPTMSGVVRLGEAIPIPGRTYTVYEVEEGLAIDTVPLAPSPDRPSTQKPLKFSFPTEVDAKGIHDAISTESNTGWQASVGIAKSNCEIIPS